MNGIPRRILGRTNLQVTTLGFGAMELRGGQNGPSLSDDDAEKLLNQVLDKGINFIDTSIDYGRSEELIGKCISHRRSEYVLASKCGCVPNAPQGSPHVHTAQNIRKGV
ncbi:MAG: aldo/keto reductase, partial [Chloroflexota bacterium]|nr:aldo/keto reductase [Chloroflexota bacterium]